MIPPSPFYLTPLQELQQATDTEIEIKDNKIEGKSTILELIGKPVLFDLVAEEFMEEKCLKVTHLYKP